MEVKPLETAEEGEWDAFVRSRPDANYCMDSAWRGIIGSTYGKRPEYWICREGPSRAVTGVAAAFWMDSLLFGRRLVALPYLDYGGILAATPSAAGELLAALRHAAATRRARLEIRQERALRGLEAPPNSKVRMDLDLRGRSVESYWSSLDAKVRNQIRKAEKSGVTVRTGGLALLDEFYRVFCVNMRDLGSPVHSKALFRNALERLPGAEMVLADLKGWCVGGLMRIRWGGTMAIPWASTLRAYRSACPNNAIYWDTLAAAFRQGCDRVDFGRSTRGEGTYRFKQQWLAEESELPWYSFGAPAVEAAPSPAAAPGGILRMVSSLWTRLPARYANRIGPPIRAALSN
jgi:FemAB-related protein (PEP-CTERM system-associated)